MFGVNVIKVGYITLCITIVSGCFGMGSPADEEELSKIVVGHGIDPPAADKKGTPDMVVDLDSASLTQFELFSKMDTEVAGLKAGSHDGLCTVTLTQEGKSTMISCELVAVDVFTEANGNECSTLVLSGVPTDGDLAYKNAIDVCRLLGIPTHRIEQWLANYKRGSHEKCEQRALSGNRAYTVEIRSSFDEQKPWQLVLTISESESLVNQVFDNDKIQK